MIKTIPLDCKIGGTRIFLPFKAICIVTDKEFGGEIIIEYHPTNKALEYVNAEDVVNELCKEKISAEELVHKVYEEVKVSIEPLYLKVTMDVKFSNAHKPVQVWMES